MCGGSKVSHRHLDQHGATLIEAVLFIVIISMVMLYSFPQIGLWLPNYLYR